MIRSRVILAAIGAMLLMTAAAFSQDKPRFLAFPSDSPERGTTRVLYWDRVDNHAAGQVAIDFGRPVWKQAYEAPEAFDSMTKGKTWRLGSNYWTVLDAGMPLTIGGQKVPAGQWYLGVHRSQDGANWSLVFVDPTKVRKGNIDASEIERAPVEFEVPLKMEKSSDVKDKLNIDLIYENADNLNVMLKISWGNFQLSAPISVPARG